MRICIIEPIGIPTEVVRAGLPGHDVVYFDSRGWSDERLIAECAGADILTLTNRPVSGAVIEALDRLRMIAVAFAGVDAVDASATGARGIPVRASAGYADTSVAELVIGFMVSLARDIPKHNAAIRSGGVATPGTELKGKTVGVIGAGGIGGEVIRLCAAFGMTTQAFDRDSAIPLKTVFADSDFVTLHIPLLPSTRGMVSDELLGAMKPSAFLINAARGPIVDSSALVTALREGRLAGAALDVFDEEPPLPAGYPLLGLPNVIATPHIGFDTHEAVQAKGELALRNIQAFITGSSSTTS